MGVYKIRPRRKVPEVCEFSPRILLRTLLRILPEFFQDFSCFVAWELETTNNSPKIPAIFQCQMLGSKQKGPAEQVAPRVSSLKICRFWLCVFPLIPWRKYDFRRPLFGGDFLGQILAADSLPGAFVHSRYAQAKWRKWFTKVFWRAGKLRTLLTFSSLN